ncbi:MAG: alanine racemase [Candidatus Spyradocola sp.]|jgi:alanine racemase
MHSIRPTRLEIDLDAICANYTALRDAAGGTKALAVVKADAYGHGAVPVARALQKAGADMFAVALIEEGIQLREAGISDPILMLGATDGPGALAAAEYGITEVVFTRDALLALEGAAKSLGVHAKAHLKLDTGMNRIGVRTEEELRDLLDAARLCPHVEITGAMTHCAAADDPNSEFTLEQLERFERLLRVTAAYGLHLERHAAASAAAVRYPQARYDRIRAGIALYGFDPTHVLSLRPAMRLVTRVTHVKRIAPGETVSYGRRFTAQRETDIATIPIGYADGYRRAFSNRAQALVHGVRVPVAGSVCMDQVMLDVTGLSVRPGDEVVLLGRQGEQEITSEELADLAETIPYEIMTGISARVPRVYPGAAPEEEDV